MHHSIPLRTPPSPNRVRSLSFALLVSLCIGSSIPLSAQTADTGAIYGRVLNVTSERYIKNAHVQVVGANIETFTDETGDFVLSRVPAGEVTLRVVYPGLDAREIKVTVTAGHSTEQMIRMTRGDIKISEEDEQIVVLDAFVVAAERDTNAASIATAEQRHSAHMKTVVAGDSFGDVPEGNVGEFLRFLPGIEAESNATEVRGLSLRGFDSEQSGVSVDGFRSASPSSGNDNRGFDLRAVSINSIARAEVIKVPLADLPADSLGGSVNLVMRSAFEFTKPSFNYTTSLSVNSENIDLKKGKENAEEKNWKILPSGTFNYVNPISKNLGITFNGLWNNQRNANHRPVYNWRLTGGAATPTAPFLQSYQIQDGPSAVTRGSLSTKIDWKASPGNVLSVGASWSYYYFWFHNRNITYTTGTSAALLNAITDFSPTHTQGPDGGGSVAYGGSWRNFSAPTGKTDIKYTYDIAGWRGEIGGSYSRSKSAYRDTRDGYFQTYSTRLLSPTRTTPTVRLYDIGDLPTAPKVLARDRTTGAAIDHTNLANYQLTDVRSAQSEGEVEYENINANTRRDFYLGSNTLTLKLGFDVRRETRDNRRLNEIWNYVGADRLAGTADDTMERFADQFYNEDARYGNGVIQWVSPIEMYRAFQADPGAFVYQAAASYQNRVTGSSYIQETIPAAYIRADAKLMEGRLHLVAGVRREETRSNGTYYSQDQDAAFRDSAGQIVRNEAGVRVRQSTTAAGSLEERQLIYKERANTAKRVYADYYPSAALIFKVTENTLLRAAYAETIGRPSTGNILPLLNINEADNPTQTNLITMNNPALEPQFARSYDVSFEHYFEGGGMASIGAFVKDVYKFRTSLRTTVTPELAEELGLDPVYADGTWEVSTSTNGNHTRISGLECVFNRQIPLIPDTLGRFYLQTNATVFSLSGASQRTWPGFRRAIGNVVLRWNKGKFSADARYNFLGQRRQSNQFGTLPDLYQYLEPKHSFDLNFNYRLTENATVFVNARNITNVADVTTVYRDDTPAYARGRQTQSYGFPIYIGVKGSF